MECALLFSFKGALSSKNFASNSSCWLCNDTAKHQTSTHPINQMYVQRIKDIPINTHIIQVKKTKEKEGTSQNWVLRKVRPGSISAICHCSAPKSRGIIIHSQFKAIIEPCFNFPINGSGKNKLQTKIKQITNETTKGLSSLTLPTLYQRRCAKKIILVTPKH